MGTENNVGAAPGTLGAVVGHVKGGAYPRYEATDDACARIAKCIAFELQHGGSEVAAAKAIIRDVQHGHIIMLNTVTSRADGGEEKGGQE